MGAETSVRTDRRQANAALVEHWLQEEDPPAVSPQVQSGLLNSDAAAVMGLDPHKSVLDLWREKVGLLMGMQSDQGPKPEFKRSVWESMLEPLVASVYSSRTGNPVRRVNRVLQHPEHPWMLACLRWEVLGTAEVQHLVCIKLEAQTSEVWDAGVPEAVRMDVMHLLAVTGQRAVDIAFLGAEGRLRVMRLERDESLIEQLVKQESLFWEKLGRSGAR